MCSGPAARRRQEPEVKRISRSSVGLVEIFCRDTIFSILEWHCLASVVHGSVAQRAKHPVVSHPGEQQGTDWVLDVSWCARCCFVPNVNTSHHSWSVARHLTSCPMLFSENVVPTTATRAVVAVATRRATVTKILLNAIIADRFVKDDDEGTS